MSLTLTLPVSGAVKKYLIVHLGNDYKLSQTDPFGMYLFNMMRRPLSDKQYDGPVSKFSSKFTVRIVPASLYDRACRNMSTMTVYHFTSFVENIIRTEMHGFVDNHAAFGLTVHGAILSFMEKYNLTDEDYSFDALKRSYHRFKKKQSNRAKSPSDLSLFPARSNATFAA